MNRNAVLSHLGKLRKGVPVFISPGLSNYTIGAEADDPLTIYNMDMPYAAPMALGAALGWPARKIVAVEGDGSLLAGPGVLTTIARYRPTNLVVLVFDNGAYLTTGSGRAPTATASGTDIELMARAAGLERTSTVSTLDEACEALERAMREPGPWLIVAKVTRQDRDERRTGSLPVDVFESGLRFRRAALTELAGESSLEGTSR
jgi:sulfopyruvate decarboxylase subunit beta